MTFSHLLLTAIIIAACVCGCNKAVDNTAGPGEVKLITLDPGHFHAALVQKQMYGNVAPEVYVYGPAGPDVQDHINRINSFNMRKDNPTSWREKVYIGPDYLEKMIQEKSGNVVVISGNNAKKTDYIFDAVNAGFNVLADKPMVIRPEKFELLKKTFQAAREKGVLLYDIMTERHEINTIIQKELSHIPAVFGQLEKGTPDAPAVTKESVHHFYKYVAGNPIKRPAWFFDSNQEGAGLLDVTTHLVDLVQWECFPEKIIDYKNDIEMLSARQWTTDFSLEQFMKVTRLEAFPEYLAKNTEGDKLKVNCNGEMIYRINGVCAKVSVIWNYQAPEGTGDTHYSIMRGNKCNLIIRQGKQENYKPALYVEANSGVNIESELQKAINEVLQKKYPGVGLAKLEPGKWRIEIPAEYHIGHESHFGQVTQKYLKYLKEGKLPEWEVPNMIAKYYITTEALKTAE